MQDINIKELLKKDNARIRWVNYGVANTFSYNHKGKEYKVIEINKKLIDEPKLFYPILFHELKHSKKLFSQDDLINDFSLANLKSLPNMKIVGFMIKNPTSLVQTLPAYYTKRHGLVLDINLSFIWIIAIAIGLFLKFKVF
jgi:predicted PolB exonuclease-like 3'-5' exonuclease